MPLRKSISLLNKTTFAFILLQIRIVSWDMNIGYKAADIALNHCDWWKKKGDEA
jgi:hypothetical protein